MMQFSCLSFTPQLYQLNQQEVRVQHNMYVRTANSRTADDDMVEDSYQDKQQHHIHFSIDSFVKYIIGKMEN